VRRPRGPLWEPWMLVIEVVDVMVEYGNLMLWGVVRGGVVVPMWPRVWRVLLQVSD
jgi:hypothetical protein